MSWGLDWRDRAACIGMDSEFFFPLGCTGAALDQVEEAKAVCRRCPVITQCLEWAIETNQQDGVWGGLSKDERRTLRRSRYRTRKSNG
jgi:WhiB family transcriptional regulator, redox-sensing transcriptional regulator